MNQNKRVYISGKVTGLEEEAYMMKFKKAEMLLKQYGFQVFNPVKRGKIPGFNWTDYMKLDLVELCECDYIYQLDEWQESEGAKFEYEVATKLNIPVLQIGIVKN